MAAIATHDHKDHNNIKGSHLKANKGSADAQVTAIALFDIELETNSSVPTKKENKSFLFLLTKL